MATKAQEQRIFREAVQAALRLDEFDLTLSFDEPFALCFEDDEETWFGAVTGTQGDERGVVIVRGPEGLRWIRDMADGVPDDDQLDRYTERIEFVLRRIGDVHPARRGALLAAGAASMRGGLVPEFHAKERNKSEHDLRTREAKRITMTLCALTGALETDLDAFEAAHPAGILPTMHVAGDWRVPDVRFELASHVDDLGRADVPVRRGLDAGDWPVVEERWSLAIVEHTFAPVAEDESDASAGPGDDSGAGAGPAEARPVQILLVADSDAKTLVGYLPVIQGTARQAAKAFARGLFISELGRRAKRFAGQLSFTDPVLRAFVAEALEADGVTCVAVEKDEAIEHVRARFGEILEASAAAIARGEAEFGDEDDFEDAVEEDDHVHGPGCDHGHGGDDFDDDFDDEDDEEVEEAPDAVGNVLRDAGLTGEPGKPQR